MLPNSDCGKQYEAKPGNTSAVWLVVTFFLILIEFVNYITCT